MSQLWNGMDIAVRQVNSVNTNYSMALKYHKYTIKVTKQKTIKGIKQTLNGKVNIGIATKIQKL